MGELAYAIDPADDGWRWRWRVFDVEGELVAGGVEPSQAAAESAAVALFHDGVCAASAI
ncbi:hypothetical protein [Phenylobacterium sp. NIBR 498073]|uniref:hypothetical protein n=1 Tax=Phenylobacterium sp. NIBR 498073 TaxID=3015177 RepID=UPI0022B52228|nr:hypothetical protein [Phenylobacterium sp. NIBR 498073]WGU39210.1 hypothetical protein O4N75_16405 [Phenylobacterium sp. NIBR 498073]